MNELGNLCITLIAISGLTGDVGPILDKQYKEFMETRETKDGVTYKPHPTSAISNTVNRSNLPAISMTVFYDMVVEDAV